MPRVYLRNTQTNGGTGGSIYDLLDTTGSAATLSTGNTQSETFSEFFAWQLTVDDSIGDTSFPFSLVITEGASPSVRVRVQRVNSSNVVQASSAYSNTFTGTGTHTGTLTLDTTWSEGDRLRLSFEFRRNPGGHGNANAQVGVNREASHVEYTAQVTHIGAADLEATATLTANGASFGPGKANLVGTATLTAKSVGGAFLERLTTRQVVDALTPDDPSGHTVYFRVGSGGSSKRWGSNANRGLGSMTPDDPMYQPSYLILEGDSTTPTPSSRNNDRYVFSADAIGEHEDIDIIGSGQSSTSYGTSTPITMVGLMVRGRKDGTAKNAWVDTGYMVGIGPQSGVNNPQALHLWRITGPTAQTVVASTAFTYQTLTAFLIRIKAEGARIRAKAWRAADPEPAEWMLDYTDGSPYLDGNIAGCGYLSPNTSNGPAFNWRSAGVAWSVGGEPTWAFGDTLPRHADAAFQPTQPLIDRIALMGTTVMGNGTHRWDINTYAPASGAFSPDARYFAYQYKIRQSNVSSNIHNGWVLVKRTSAGWVPVDRLRDTTLDSGTEWGIGGQYTNAIEWDHALGDVFYSFHERMRGSYAVRVIQERLVLVDDPFPDGAPSAFVAINPRGDFLLTGGVDARLFKREKVWEGKRYGYPARWRHYVSGVDNLVHPFFWGGFHHATWVSDTRFIATSAVMLPSNVTADYDQAYWNDRVSLGLFEVDEAAGIIRPLHRVAIKRTPTANVHTIPGTDRFVAHRRLFRLVGDTIEPVAGLDLDDPSIYTEETPYATRSHISMLAPDTKTLVATVRFWPGLVVYEYDDVSQTFSRVDAPHNGELYNPPDFYTWPQNLGFHYQRMIITGPDGWLALNAHMGSSAHESFGGSLAFYQHINATPSLPPGHEVDLVARASMAATATIHAAPKAALSARASLRARAAWEGALPTQQIAIPAHTSNDYMRVSGSGQVAVLTTIYTVSTTSKMRHRLLLRGAKGWRQIADYPTDANLTGWNQPGASGMAALDRFLIARIPSGDSGVLRAMDAMTGLEAAVALPSGFSNPGGSSAGDSAVHPSGRYIAMRRGTVSEVGVVRVNPTWPVTLTSIWQSDHASLISPDATTHFQQRLIEWSPDGRTLAVIINQNTTLINTNNLAAAFYRFDENAETVTLIGWFYQLRAAQASTGNSLLPFTGGWSPDSRYYIHGIWKRATGDDDPSIRLYERTDLDTMVSRFSWFDGLTLYDYGDISNAYETAFWHWRSPTHVLVPGTIAQEAFDVHPDNVTKIITDPGWIDPWYPEVYGASNYRPFRNADRSERATLWAPPQLATQADISIAYVEETYGSEATLWAWPINLTGTATLTASATAEAVGPQEHLGAADLEAVATLAAEGEVAAAPLLGAAALEGTAALTATAITALQAEATLASTATVTAVGSLVRHGVASITATATVTASARRLALATSTLASTASLTASGQRLALATATLPSTALVTALGVRQPLGASTLPSTATLTATSVGVTLAEASLTATATLTSEAVIIAEQRQRPTRTTINTGWVNQDGHSDDLHLSVAGDDVDYGTWAQSSQPPGDEKFGTGFDLLAPVNRAGHQITVIAGKYPSEDGQQINLSLELRERDTIIATWQWTNLPLVDVSTFTLTEEQAEQIIHYPDVELRFTAAHEGGGATRGARLYWVEFETPAAITRAHASLVAQALVTADVRLIRTATSTLPATASVTANAIRLALGSAAVTATATATAAGVRQALGSAAITATASVTTAGTLQKLTSATLPASATLSATGALVRYGSAAMATTAALAASGVRQPTAIAALPATATVTADALRLAYGHASITATATLTANLVDAIDVTAELKATAALVVAGRVIRHGVAALPAAAALTAIGTRQAISAASLATAAGLTAAGTRQALAIAELPTTASVTALGTRVAFADAPLHATASLSANLVSAVDVTAELLTAATLAASGRVIRHATAALASTAALTSVGTRQAIGVAALPATTTLTAAGIRQALGHAGLGATASLAADLQKVTPALLGDATLESTAQLLALAQLILSGHAGLAAQASLDATAVRQAIGHAYLDASADLDVDASVFGLADADLHAFAYLDASALVIPPRLFPRKPGVVHFNPHDPQATHINPHDPQARHRRKGGPNR